MDTSKEHIKMCEKFPELQPHDLEFENGDYVVYKGNWGIYFDDHFYFEGIHDEGLIDYELNPFRLHTQGQLQKMISFPNAEKIGIWFEKHIAFYEWCGEKNKGLQNNWGKFKSIEQLWLAFVMKKNHNKVWVGEEWKG